MHAIRQKCRPKHQVLILKCYPRTTKGAVDVKPNSSELSYLLYYATTRRSKVQKVGAFLEKKTASDVWRARIGYVKQGDKEVPRIARSNADSVLQKCTSYSPNFGGLDRESPSRSSSVRALCAQNPQHHPSIP
jgi:hypothetical protein